MNFDHSSSAHAGRCSDGTRRGLVHRGPCDAISRLGHPQVAARSPDRCWKHRHRRAPCGPSPTSDAEPSRRCTSAGRWTRRAAAPTPPAAMCRPPARASRSLRRPRSRARVEGARPGPGPGQQPPLTEPPPAPGSETASVGEHPPTVPRTFPERATRPLASLRHPERRPTVRLPFAATTLPLQRNADGGPPTRIERHRGHTPRHHRSAGAHAMTRFTGQTSKDLLSFAFFGLLVLTPFVI